MTQEHDDIRDDLPAWAARRLPPERRQVVERHLAACRECREAAADFEAIAAGIVSGGDPLFAPHPESAALRRFSIESGDAEDPAIRKHLDICATCSLEVSVWRRVGERAPVRQDARARRGMPRLALATAGGIVLGILLATLYRGLGPAIRPPAPGSPSPNASPSTPPAEAPTSQIGQPILYVLPDALRNGRLAPVQWNLDPADTYIGVAVPIAIPDGAGAEDLCAIELRRVGGAVVWSTEMSVSRLRRHMQAADVVHIPAIPTRLVPPGSYDFVVRPARDGGRALLYRAAIEISYRQSPAATNAPQ
jgi:putative zinc finger protein